MKIVISTCVLQYLFSSHETDNETVGYSVLIKQDGVVQPHRWKLSQFGVEQLQEFTERCYRMLSPESIVEIYIEKDATYVGNVPVTFYQGLVVKHVSNIQALPNQDIDVVVNYKNRDPLTTSLNEVNVYRAVDLLVGSGDVTALQVNLLGV